MKRAEIPGKVSRAVGADDRPTIEFPGGGGQDPPPADDEDPECEGQA